MTPGDREALTALERRLYHAAAIARMIAEVASDLAHDDDVAVAVKGVATIIEDASERLDAIISAATS